MLRFAPEGWARCLAAIALIMLSAFGCAEDRSALPDQSEPVLPSYTGVASESADGVLTNLPGTRFLTSGDLVLTSAYLELSRFESEYALVVWADVENRGDEALCLGIANMKLNGEELGGLVYGGARVRHRRRQLVGTAARPPRAPVRGHVCSAQRRWDGAVGAAVLHDLG